MRSFSEHETIATLRWVCDHHAQHIKLGQGLPRELIRCRLRLWKPAARDAICA